MIFFMDASTAAMVDVAAVGCCDKSGEGAGRLVVGCCGRCGMAGKGGSTGKGSPAAIASCAAWWKCWCWCCISCCWNWCASMLGTHAEAAAVGGSALGCMAELTTPVVESRVNVWS